jgi:CRP-like cAMP-binding protein
MTANELFDYFQQNLICESLRLSEVDTLTGYLQDKSYERDEVISDMGEVGESMMFVVKGKVGFDSFDGQDNVNVGLQGVGNLVGEMSFFDRKPRNLRMYAASKKVKVLILTRSMYDRLKIEQPFIAVNILENAVVSLDHLVRSMSESMAQIEHYVHGFGRH